MTMTSRRSVERIFYNNEQYVSFYGIIEAIREIAEDFCEEGYHEADQALSWVAEQLQFSMIVDGIRSE